MVEKPTTRDVQHAYLRQYYTPESTAHQNSTLGTTRGKPIPLKRGGYPSGLYELLHKQHNTINTEI